MSDTTALSAGLRGKDEVVGGKGMHGLGSCRVFWWPGPATAWFSHCEVVPASASVNSLPHRVGEI